MRKIISLSLVALGLVACGDDPPKPPPPKAKAGGGGGGGAPASGPSSGPQLSLRPKVDKMYRKEFTKADFQPDETGDINRNPFFSYLVSATPAPGTPGSKTGSNAGPTDECEGRTVALKYNYGDLSLIGIIMQGTKSFAMFKDPQSTGHIAYQGECLSKDKARIIEITPSCVIMEIRGEAAPGAPAPAAHQEPKCTHPDDIEIQ